MLPMTVLEGYVEHRLNVVPQNASSSSRENQKRVPDRPSIPDDTTDRIGQSTAGSSSRGGDVGFYLVAEDNGMPPPSGRSSSRTTKKLEYLLSVPMHLLKALCDAARFGDKVRVTQYSLIPLLSDISNNKQAGLSWSSSSTAPLLLVEVHEDGLEILKTLNPSGGDSGTNFLTLDRVFKEEEAKNSAKNNDETANGNNNSKKRKRHSRSSRYNLQGTVDSISPVIVVDEPFALMELYDAESPRPYSCVVVLQGAAMACHDGIMPGDCVRLRQVKRQRWRIPDEIIRSKLSRMEDRVPSHVFVLRESTNIVWRTTNIPATVSTAIPLVSIQGRVVIREWASRGSSSQSKTSYMIHSIELESSQKKDMTSSDTLGNTASRHVLLLIYYPMSPALSASLRIGTEARAVNIHHIGASLGPATPTSEKCNAFLGGRPIIYYYTACLRSTVSILRRPPTTSREIATQKSTSVLSNDDVHRGQSGAVEDIPYSRPYALLTVQKSYFEFACRKQIYQWFHKNNFQLIRESRRNWLPTTEQLSAAWWKHHCSLHEEKDYSFKKRNPYLEFFDHACDDGGDNDDGDSYSSVGSSSEPRRRQVCGCCGENSRSFSVPCWVGLHELQDCGFRLVQDRIEEAFRPKKDCPRASKPHVGWTATIDLPASLLIRILQGRGVDPEEDFHGSGSCDDSPLYTGGTVIHSGKASTAIHLSSASLANDFCELPSTTLLEKSFADTVESTHEQYLEEKSGFAFGLLEGVAVSAFCVSASGYQRTDDHTQKNEGTSTGSVCHSTEFLPRHDDFVSASNAVLGSQQRGLRGACSVWRCTRGIFLLSIQLKFRSLLCISSSESAECDAHNIGSESTKKASNPRLARNQFLSIQNCLLRESSLPAEEGSDKHNCRVVGVLARQRLRVSRITGNRYGGCVLTISHLPIELVEAVDDISTLQNVEVKTIIHYSKLPSRRMLLKSILTRATGSDSALDDIVNLALAWWSMADKADSCALTHCGCDDQLQQSSTSVPDRFHQKRAPFFVIVQLPGKVAQQTDVRGYARFECALSEVTARFLQSNISTNFSAGTLIQGEPLAAFFDCVGGFKFFPGMLDRRPLRQIRRDDVLFLSQSKFISHCAGVKRELLSLPPSSISGIPECSLGEMLRCLCLDLQNVNDTPKTTFLAPSLVRKVSGARDLGISFCRAQVVCTKCFKALCSEDKKRKYDPSQKHSHGRMKKGNQMNRSDEEHYPSFWDRPLPLNSGTLKQQVYDSSRPQILDKASLSGRMRSNLCCPNGCSVEAYAEVKWECSCAIDDGSGQAKLYAEREAAILLLGISQESVEIIEEGAWMHERGCIIFSKAAPPPSYLGKAVEAANFKYISEQNRNRSSPWGQRKGPASEVKERSALRLLEPVDRAVYVMYEHCRVVSYETTRQMDYLVRCKPVADNLIHLNRTEIEVVAPGAREGSRSIKHVATYSLPPLKLSLVDCSIASRTENTGSSGNSFCVVDETWDLLRGCNT